MTPSQMRQLAATCPTTVQQHLADWITKAAAALKSAADQLDKKVDAHSK
jgi:hypothetical protein